MTTSNFREIKKEDMEMFRHFFKQDAGRISELTFTNLYMWRHYYNFRFMIYNELLCIISTESLFGDAFAFFPIGQCSKEKSADTIQFLKTYFFKNGYNLRFERVDEVQLSIFKSLHFSQVNVIADRDQFDYLYAATDLISLTGRKYHAKRNHIHKFSETYSHEFVPFNYEMIVAGKEFIRKWYLEKYTYPILAADMKADLELLDNALDFGCVGGFIYIKDKIEAITIGEQLTSDTAVIHLEKANRNIQGIYSVVNQEFCERAWSHMVYINREQDLGDAGLRKAKLSYHPIELIKKYKIEFYG